MLMAIVPTHAEKWSAENIPMVHLSNKYRYVSDPDGIMSRKSRQKADSLLRKLDKECGVESAFIIVNNVEGGDPFRVAQDVGNKYGIGKKATNRGLVVVIAVKDRKYFIAPGEGLEKDLTDAECDKIAKACIVANMRENKPGEACRINRPSNIFQNENRRFGNRRRKRQQLRSKSFNPRGHNRRLHLL